MDHPPADVACRPAGVRLALAASLLLVACGGGGGSDDEQADPGTPAIRVSADTPVTPGCGLGANTHVNAEVEPFLAADPRDRRRLVAVWQQDRHGDGGARAIASAVSEDGGRSWSARTLHAMSRCGGAVPGSAVDFARATDPWVDTAPDGTVHAMALAFNGAALQPGSASAMLASRSTDGGRSWSAPVALVHDGETLFNDKNAITADPTDARFVYAVWDRLDRSGHGPTLFARSADGGLSWEPARAVVIPASAGVSQTLGNRIVVVPEGAQRGTLVNVYTQIDTVAGTSSARVMAVRSADRGLSWSAPVAIGELRAVGARDPGTGTRIRDGALLPAVASGGAGRLYVAWQDARFSAGQRDAIVLARSDDGGASWSAPVAVNTQPGVAAFTPTLHVRADGRVGLLHYDLRHDNADAAPPLLADAWLLSSADGVLWSESHVAGPFDFAAAPAANGLPFLGDYQGLASAGDEFLPLYAASAPDAGNRSDIFVRPVTVTAAAAARAERALARRAAADTEDPVLRERHHQAVLATLERRVPGWASRTGARTAEPR